MKRFAAISILPSQDLSPGRYVLDGDGRLHPFRYRSLVRAVAVVTVKCKPNLEALQGLKEAVSKVRERSQGDPTTKLDNQRLAAAFQRHTPPQRDCSGGAAAEGAGPNDICSGCGVRAVKHVEAGCQRWRV